MSPDDATSSIAHFTPRSLSAEVACFARTVVAEARPKSPARAKALLFAAGKLGTFCASVGLELRPAVVLSGPVIERFIVTEGARLHPATRRTLRSNLRFLARAVVVGPSAPVPLCRERAKAPYADAELRAYLSLADAQPTLARRMRLLGLIALGAGAGLMGEDLRGVRGTDVVERFGGVLVCVQGRRARVVPVLARKNEQALEAARFAGAGYVVGGSSGARRNVTSGLVASVAGGADLPAIDTSRLRATWLKEAARAIGLKAFMDAAGITCSQRLGDLVGGLDHVGTGRRALGRVPVKEADALGTYEAIVDRSAVASRIEALLPLGVRPRQLSVRTLLIGILVALADGRPAHLTRVHGALVALCDPERRRLGVVAEWKNGPHLLSYRQVERTVGLVVGAMTKG